MALRKVKSITVQAKDITCDWRAFMLCSDGEHNWELRGYGTTKAEAIADVKRKYNDLSCWYLCGEVLNGSIN